MKKRIGLLLMLCFVLWSSVNAEASTGMIDDPFEGVVEMNDSAPFITSQSSYIKTYDAANNRRIFRFIPTDTFTYEIRTTGGVDTSASLYNSSSEQVSGYGYNDDQYEYNFSITADLMSGNLYYLVVYNFDSLPLEGLLSELTFSHPLVTPITPAAPSVTADDTTNKIIGADASMEYSADGGAWITYNTTSEPTFPGVKSVQVRVKASGLDLAGSITTVNFNLDTFNIGDGDITIEKYFGTLMITSGAAQTIQSGIPNTQEIIIQGSTNTNKIVVNGATAKITLDNANIQLAASSACAFELQNSANVTLTLKDGTTNYLKSGNNKAGLAVPTGTTLKLQDNGILNVTGGYSGAGIGGGGNAGTVNITGGTVNAQGGEQGAGIGGSGSSSGGTTTISGGIVNAIGGNGAAGIGGGLMGSGGTITITNGTVTAIGGDNGIWSGGAGIGAGGSLGSEGTITIYAAASV
ncbi:MAG: DUF4073 domain-containing protein, partial [Mobilitalea sp.]